MMPSGNKGNFAMVRGAVPRPRDPDEDKYSLARSLPPRAVDLSQPRLLVGPDADPRQPVFDQGNMGSCASCSSCAAVYTARNTARLLKGQKADAVQFNPAPLYYQARLKHKWERDDTGSMIADNLDLLLEDAPVLNKDFPYSDDYARPWDMSAWTKDAITLDYEKSHRPFYPKEGRVLENIWTALAAGLPIVLGTLWPDEWFSPVAGKLPLLPSINPNVGGHAIYCWGMVPGWILCRNSWSAQWSSDAGKFGSYMQPGDFAMPWEYLTRPSSPVFELRAVSPEPVIIPEPGPAPEPQPQPQPDPGPSPVPSGYSKAAVMELVTPVMKRLKQAVKASSGPARLNAQNQFAGGAAVRDALENGLS